MAPKKESGAAPTRVSSRQAATGAKKATEKAAEQAKPTKPVANTKAKVTKPASKAKSTAATKAAATKTAKVAAAKTTKAAKEVKPAAKPSTTKTKPASTTKSKAKSAAADNKDAPKKPAADKPVEATASPTEEAKKPAASRKRKAEDEPTAPVAKKVKVVKKGPVINSVPTQILNVYTMGSGESGELGLGTKNKHCNVKRPRLNPNLSPDTVGVVQVACGGMHAIALTHDNKLFTWGVNDQGTLGRDTTWDGGVRDIDDEDSDVDEDDPETDKGLNPRETIPTAIPSDAFPADTVFVQVAAGDSCTFALTDDGQVWGWGTFRSGSGISGFLRGSDKKVESKPVLIPGLKKITKIACGTNHALALDNKGQVFSWGDATKAQLGRKGVERRESDTLVPTTFGLPKGKNARTRDITCGEEHSFAIDTNDNVWTWGMNNFGQTGIVDGAGEDNAVIEQVTVVKSLAGKKIISIAAGQKHSLAATDTGDCLTWGRIDNKATGHKISDLHNLPEGSLIMDPHKPTMPRILTVPTKVASIEGKVVSVAAGTETSFALTEDGQAYSWGDSEMGQVGHGPLPNNAEYIELATHIDNTAIRGKKINSASSGGYFSILTSPAEETPKTNGVDGAA